MAETTSLKAPGPLSTKLSGRRKSHVRTVTRFCEDAQIETHDELDMAEFIVAANYLGVDANTDQLMEVFMEMEDAMEDSGKDPKALIKDFVAKVEDLYGMKALEMDDDDEKDEEIMAPSLMGVFAEDQKWQDQQLTGMIAGAYEDQQLSVAHKLLDTTALSLEQISEITGVPVTTLEEYVLEDDLSDDDEDGLPMKKSEMFKVTVTGTDSAPASDGKKVDLDPKALQKSLALTIDDIALLDELVADGAAKVKAKSAETLELLKKMKFAVEMTKTGHRKMKSAMRLRTQILSSADVSKVVEAAVAKEESRFPAKYRVIIHPGALVKAEEKLDSAEVAKIKIGVKVTVEEIVGRRARISKPIAGWLSVKSTDGRVILQKEGTRSAEMTKAVQEERGRKTKILILKSVTTLNDATVERILEKSEWNLRRAIDAFYMTKYQTQLFTKKQASKKAESTSGGDSGADGSSATDALVPKKDGAAKSTKLSFWKQWKLFATQN